MSFSREMWEAIQPTYQQILEHPFNQEMIAGTLAPEKFCYFVDQDEVYLPEMARSLSLIATKVSDTKLMLWLLKLASLAISEKEEGVFSHYRQLFQCRRLEKQAPTVFAYTNFLLATAATMPMTVSLGTIYPCVCIYPALAKDMLDRVVGNNNRYIVYFEYMSSFTDVSVQTQAVLDDVADKASPDLLEGMKKAAYKSLEFEWQLFDDVYYGRSLAKLA